MLALLLVLLTHERCDRPVPMAWSAADVASFFVSLAEEAQLTDFHRASADCITDAIDGKTLSRLDVNADLGVSSRACRLYERANVDRTTRSGFADGVRDVSEDVRDATDVRDIIQDVRDVTTVITATPTQSVPDTSFLELTIRSLWLANLQNSPAIIAFNSARVGDGTNKSVDERKYARYKMSTSLPMTPIGHHHATITLKTLHFTTLR